MTLPDDRSIPLDRFPENARKFLGPQSPKPMKLMLARGLVPMQPVVQVCAMYQLAQEDDEELARTAAGTVQRLPPATLLQVASASLLPVVLDWLADLFQSARELQRAVLLNPQTSNDTVVRVAQTADEETCELIARNQQRLLADARIIPALYFNRNLRASTADRIIDFGARNNVDLSSIPGAEDVIAAVQGSVKRTDAELALADERFKAAQNALAAFEDRSIEELEELFLARGDEDDPDDPNRKERTEADADASPDKEMSSSAAGMIRDMNVAQKIRLALMGGRSERAVLIQDSNKIVARAVIRSPAISDSEAMVYAKNRALIDEVVSFMARQKKWTRHYQMKLSLVMNPKTPLSEALVFLKHLRPGDLRSVARSRQIPGPVAKAAKELLKARMK